MEKRRAIYGGGLCMVASTPRQSQLKNTDTPNLLLFWRCRTPPAAPLDLRLRWIYRRVSTFRRGAARAIVFAKLTAGRFGARPPFPHHHHSHRTPGPQIYWGYPILESLPPSFQYGTYSHKRVLSRRPRVGLRLRTLRCYRIWRVGGACVTKGFGAHSEQTHPMSRYDQSPYLEHAQRAENMSPLPPFTYVVRGWCAWGRWAGGGRGGGRSPLYARCEIWRRIWTPPPYRHMS